jgi:hypothetical protein
MWTDEGSRFQYSDYTAGARILPRSTHIFCDLRLDTEAGETPDQDDNSNPREPEADKEMLDPFWFTKHLKVSEGPQYFPVDSPSRFISASEEEPSSSSGPDLITDLANPPIFKLYMGQSLFGFCARYPDGKKKLTSAVKKHGFLHLHLPFLTLSPADILRLEMAQECYAVYPSLLEHQFVRKHPTAPMQWHASDVLCRRVEDLPISSGDASRIVSDSDVSILVSLFISGLAYGGLHLLAWSPPVRTATETLLWRISGVTTIVYGAMPLFIILFIIAGYYACRGVAWTYKRVAPGWLRNGVVALFMRVFKWVREVLSRLVDWIDVLLEIRVVLWVFTCVLIVPAFVVVAVVVIALVAVVGVGVAVVVGASLFYVFSRIYLVVECFISVGRLPESAFETPYWAQYMPHLS